MGIKEQIKEIRAKLKDVSLLRKVLRDRIEVEEFESSTGIKFELIDEGRDIHQPSCYFFIFSLNGIQFRCDGYYDSQSGISLDDYDVKSFYHVEQVETVITEWQQVNLE